MSTNGIDYSELRLRAKQLIRQFPRVHQSLAERYIIGCVKDPISIMDMGFLQFLEQCDDDTSEEEEDS